MPIVMDLGERCLVEAMVKSMAGVTLFLLAGKQFHNCAPAIMDGLLKCVSVKGDAVQTDFSVPVFCLKNGIFRMVKGFWRARGYSLFKGKSHTYRVNNESALMLAQHLDMGMTAGQDRGIGIGKYLVQVLWQCMASIIIGLSV